MGNRVARTDKHRSGDEKRQTEEDVVSGSGGAEPEKTDQHHARIGEQNHFARSDGDGDLPGEKGHSGAGAELDQCEEQCIGVADQIAALERQHRNRNGHDDGEIDQKTGEDQSPQRGVAKYGEAVLKDRFPRGFAQAFRLVDPADVSRSGEAAAGADHDDCGEHPQAGVHPQDQADGEQRDEAGEVEETDADGDDPRA